MDEAAKQLNRERRNKKVKKEAATSVVVAGAGSSSASGEVNPALSFPVKSPEKTEGHAKTENLNYVELLALHFKKKYST